MIGKFVIARDKVETAWKLAGVYWKYSH